MNQLLEKYRMWRRVSLATVLALMTALLAGVSSCSDDDSPFAGDGDGAEDGYITLTLRCNDIQTRATEDAVDELNENKIETVTLMLWPGGGDRPETVAPVYMQTFRDLNANKVATLRVALTQELINNLFNVNGLRTCHAFVAVNVDPGEAKTVAELRRLAIAAPFATTKVMDSFAMDGDGEVAFDGVKATGNIDVKRSAAKITLELDVDDSVVEDAHGTTLTWTPNLNGMHVKLQSGVEASTLDPAPTTDMDDSYYFNTSDGSIYDFVDNTTAGGYPKVQDTPFYTFPNRWGDRQVEPHRTMMTLSVPWTSDGGATWKTCYYQVPVVPLERHELVRNVSYHVKLHVSVLGSFVPEEPEEIEADYFAAEWSSEEIGVDIKDNRYLVVDANEFWVNNENSLDIEFYTSHPTIVTDAKMEFYRFNYSDEGTMFTVPVTMAQNAKSAQMAGDSVFSVYFQNKTPEVQRCWLKLKHDLKTYQPYDAAGQQVSLTNNVEKDGPNRPKIQDEQEIKDMLSRISYFKKNANVDEFSIVKFTITVQHKDIYEADPTSDRFRETVVIWQYPGMYITAVQNFKGLLNKKIWVENQQKWAWASGTYGNCVINGRYDDETYSGSMANMTNDQKLQYNYQNWDYSLGLSAEFKNWNPNLYLVTITRLPDGSKYHIGDPRSTNINNYLDNNNVDGGNPKTFATEYYYYQIGTTKGPESSSSFDTLFKGKENPSDVNVAVNTAYWWKFVNRGFITAPALTGGMRTLKYYYPTRENIDNRYTLAPKFRICSSYGGSSAYMTRVMARRRAAAYQELGYPAGRWRLPTEGEVEFVITLSRDNKIPRLFGQENGVWYYWCAQGAMEVPKRFSTANPKIVENPTNGGSSATAPFTRNNYRDHTRFVYDEWYWGDETLPSNGGSPSETVPMYQFTWGDMERSKKL